MPPMLNNEHYMQALFRFLVKHLSHKVTEARYVSKEGWRW